MFNGNSSSQFSRKQAITDSFHGADAVRVALTPRMCVEPFSLLVGQVDQIRTTPSFLV